MPWRPIPLRSLASNVDASPGRAVANAWAIMSSIARLQLRSLDCLSSRVRNLVFVTPGTECSIGCFQLLVFGVSRPQTLQGRSRVYATHRLYYKADYIPQVANPRPGPISPPLVAAPSKPHRTTPVAPGSAGVRNTIVACKRESLSGSTCGLGSGIAL